MNLPVECPHVSILFIPIREQSTCIGKRAFDEPFHVRLGFKQLQAVIVKKTRVKIKSFSSITLIAVGEPDELDDDVLGDRSNPISVNSSLGAETGVFCSCWMVCGTTSSVVSILSFLRFLCFFLLYLVRHPPFFVKNL